MTTTTARRISGAAITVIVLALGADIGIRVWDHAFGGENLGDLFFVPVVVVGSLLYATIGRLIVARQPRNTIGWLLLAIPLVASLALANGSYAQHTLVSEPGSLPFGVLSAWIDRWAIVAALVMFIPIFLIYPDGHLPSKRWRWVLAVTIAAPVLTVVSFALTPGRLTGAFADLRTAHVVNPLGVSSPPHLVQTLTGVFGAATFATAILGAVAIVVRFRRAGADVRQQIRWLAAVAITFFVVLVVGIVNGDRSEFVATILFGLAFLTLVVGIPVACGIAILRYRLYDLDVVIRKTVVFGLLAVFIAVVYAAVVGGIGALVGSTSNPFLSFAAAAVLAVAFQPARDRARRFADRLVYGKRATPYEVLAEFSDRMSETYATEDVLPRMTEILRAGTGADVARVWLRVGHELRPAASTDGKEVAALTVGGDVTPEVPGEHLVEVRHRGELLGALSVRMPASDPMDPAKDKLVRDLAAQAGLVLRNVKLIEDLRASRQRLVAAQDQERRRIERNIHDGAQQQLVALSVKLRLAEQLTERDLAKSREMLVQLQADTSEALENLRDLARGIYPPLLADRGLAAALEAQARKSPVPTTVELDGVGRYAPEIEATVYFCALEALQNVAKYAEASAATVRLSAEDGALRFE
ncbi:MAG TPA: histidine kinase, partial [Actinomycetota bacterium]|nr:histidine kinase [Actinomycetota bacterium]